jgi:hypothetical protein
MPKVSKYHRCKNHPERWPVIDRRGDWLCYICAYGEKAFRKYYGDDAEGFYKEGGAGYAGPPGLF